MEGRAGIDTRTEFGRIKNGRLFTRSVDSFVYFAYRATLDTEAGFTVEAWVNPAAFGQYEATPIAGRWNLGAGEQSWLLGMVGQNMKLPFASLPSPGYLNDLNLEAREGTLFFAYQPEDAGPPRVYRSSVRLPLERWSHVAASFDGEIVRIFIDGQLDAQFASIGRIRGSRAPLLHGNFFN
jgi:hypothetical protein